MKKIAIILIFFALTNTTFAQLKINEIHPNPTGKDPGKEWVEIYNTSNYPIPLENWQIHNGNKTYTFPQKNILPKTHFTYHLPLKNSNNTIKIFSEKQNDQLSYKKSKEGLSLSHTNVGWLWTENSKNTRNPIYQELSGKITQAPQIAKEYFFKIENKKIHFTENFPLLQSLFTEDTKVKILTQKNKNKLYLIDYQIQSLAKKEPRQARLPYLYLIIPIIALTLILGATLYYKSSAQTPP